MNHQISVRAQTARGTALALFVLFGLLSTSCSSMGSKKLVSSHTSYNDAVQLTVTREVLANIVRSRYADPMQFMAVSAINAQFSVSGGVSVGAGGIGQTGAAGDLGGTIGYSDSPTIYSSRVGSKGAQDEGPPVVLAVGGS